MKYEYLIIGADAAGLSAVGQIRRRDKNASVGVLEKDTIISYGACGLPYVIGGVIDDFQSLIHFTPESFAAKNKIDIHTENEVIFVDFDSKKVLARTPEGEKEYSYEKLIIASGASPVKLDQFDYNSGKVFKLKTIHDGKKIQAALKNKIEANILIVGGGYIGLELADVLSEHHRVRILDALDKPVFRMAESISNKISKKLAEKEIPFHGDELVKSSELEGERLKVITDKSIYLADIVIIAVGIRPNTDFLSEDTIKLNRGAIEVDRYAQTSVPDVYAAGDCAMVYNRLLDENVYMPLGSTANKQGRIAGMNAAGERFAFPGILQTQVFKFDDLVFAQTGINEKQAADKNINVKKVKALRGSNPGYYPGSVKNQVELIVDVDRDVIIGGTYIGAIHTAALIDVIGAMAMSGAGITDVAWFDASYAPPVAPVWNALISAAGKF